MELQSFFNPQSIAIIGVSHDRHKVGYLVAANMVDQGYEGKLFLVNPKGGTLLNRSVHKDIKEIDEPIDLAILAVPADVAIAMFPTLAKKKITNIVLFAAGFKEVGDAEGAKREKDLLEACSKYGITLLGPNCIGFSSNKSKVNATFLKHVVPAGNIGFISQSGALGSVMVDEFVARHNLGLSYFISMGNKSIIDESDALDFLAKDPETQVIALYLEGVVDGEKFKQTLARATLIKPVVILKSGTTEAGSQAAMSHTGGLAGDDSIFSSVFKQCGAIRAATYVEFTTLLHMFSYDRVPTSGSVLVLSNAGGVGVLLADELVSENLSLVTVSNRTKNELTKVFGDSKKITVHNPIDLLGDASAFDYEKAITSTIQERDVGAVVILLTPQANTEILETAKVIVKAQQGFDRPIYPVFMGKDSVQIAHDYFQEHMVASFRYHDYITHAIGKAVRYRDYLSSHAGHVDHFPDSEVEPAVVKKITSILNKSKERPFLDLEDSLKICELIGVPVAETILAKTEKDLHDAIKLFKYPVTLKIASKQITHKTEVAGVYPSLHSHESAEEAFHNLLAIKGADGAYVQKQAGGYEFFMGAKRDANFGTVIVVGLGGIYAELFKEVANRVFPFTQAEFISMLKDTRMHKLLSGFRGHAPVDMGLLYSCVFRVGILMETFPQIKELDINPLFVLPDEVRAVDARIIL
jgi:acetate---CoA ligase (ADP-forming)